MSLLTLASHPDLLAAMVLRDASSPRPSRPAQAGRRPTPSSPTPPGSRSDRASGSTPRRRRLVLRARVVLREGPLEHLLCLKGTKEHEAILATAAAPRQIHAGLLLTGAEAGHPVRFLPKFEPPTGTADRHRAGMGRGRQDPQGRRPRLGPRRATKKPARPPTGSSPAASSSTDPTTKKPYYAADDGDLITVANFASAILDLPVRQHGQRRRPLLRRPNRPDPPARDGRHDVLPPPDPPADTVAFAPDPTARQNRAALTSASTGGRSPGLS